MRRGMVFGSTLSCLMVLSGSLKAATITFSGYGFGNDTVTTYTEDGFTITKTSGSLQSTSGNGNPPPSIFASGAATFLLTGGTFNLLSFQGANGAFSGSAEYTLTGYSAGVETYSQSFATAGTSFVTFGTNALLPFDVVQFALSGPSTNIDNIVVDKILTSAVPEPSTWAMMLIGFGGLGFLGYRKSRNAAAMLAV